MDKPTIDELFDRRLAFPDLGAGRRLSRLVGIDDARNRLTKLLAVLVNPSGPRAWAQKHVDVVAADAQLQQRAAARVQFWLERVAVGPITNSAVTNMTHKQTREINMYASSE